MYYTRPAVPVPEVTRYSIADDRFDGNPIETNLFFLSAVPKSMGREYNVIRIHVFKPVHGVYIRTYIYRPK